MNVNGIINDIKRDFKHTEAAQHVFIEALISQALSEAQKYAYDEPAYEPDDREAYLQDILGFIRFNEVLNAFHRSFKE